MPNLFNILYAPSQYLNNKLRLAISFSANKLSCFKLFIMHLFIFFVFKSSQYIDYKKRYTLLILKTDHILFNF